MTKKVKSLSLLFLAILLISSSAIAQETENQVDLGYRGVIFGPNSDQARFQRYNDFSNGLTLDLFRYSKDTDKYFVKLKGEHAGYKDQRYTFLYNNFGKMKISLEYNQIPLFYSNSTRTLYTSSEPGVLTIDDSIQSGVQNKTLKLTDALNNNATLFNLESRRNVTDFHLKYNSSSSVAYGLTVKNARVNGNQPWGTSFGFTLADEIAVPKDYQTTDLGAGVELSNNRANLRFGYDGSFFRNNIPVIVWDNPLRASDSPTAGPEMGREDLWPNTDANTLSVSGGLRLPARSHLTAFVSAGQLSNNNPLIPHTINSALAFVPLTRDMSEIKVDVTAMNYTFTSRPTNWLFVNARYKQYSFDNRSLPFELGQAINFDTAVITKNAASEPYSFNRHTLTSDVTWSPFSYLGLRTGFTREEVNRTYRVIEESTENTGLASIDLTGISWLSLRGIFEHSVRIGSPINRDELLAGGQQPSLRQYDISDRNKDRYSLILVVTPVSQFSINATSGFGKENYPATDTRTVFGLRSNDNTFRSFGFDFVPIDKISLGANYGYEKYNALQTSRTASRLSVGASLDDLTQQFNDPRRDWTDSSADQTKTFDVSMDVLKIVPKTDINFGYSESWSKSSYVYGLAPNTVIADPLQLPPVTNKLKRETLNSRYFATKHIVLGFIYRFDQYDVDDFAFNPGSNLAEPATAAAQNYAMLGYFQRPYKASTFIGQLTYRW